MTEREELPEWRKNVRQSFAEAAIAAMGDKRKDDGRQAFPQPLAIGPAGDVFPAYPGMTLRQYFAGKAMAAIISKHAALKPTTGPGKDAAWDVPRLTAIGAVAYADALIAALDAE